jgi:hypothetical protein
MTSSITITAPLPRAVLLFESMSAGSKIAQN